MPEFLILLAAGAPPDEVLATLTQSGAVLTQGFDPTILIAQGDEAARSAVEALGAVVVATAGPIENADELGLDETERLVVDAWNLRRSDAYRASKENRANEGTPLDELGMIPCLVDTGDGDVSAPRPAALAASPGDNLYLIGTVAVGLVFVDGPPGTTAAFDYGERVTMVAEASEGFAILYRAAPAGAHLVFVAEIRTATPGVDPASVPAPSCVPAQTNADIANIEPRWRDPALRVLGYSVGRSGVRAYVGDLRAKPWFGQTVRFGYAAFLTKYNVGHFSYTDVPDRLHLVIQYSGMVYGWCGRPNSLAADIDITFAHETAHVFGAQDEYHPCSAAGSGYLNAPNLNCVDVNVAPVPCIMGAITPAVCPFTAAQLGWVDINGNGIPDPIDPAFNPGGGAPVRPARGAAAPARSRGPRAPIVPGPVTLIRPDDLLSLEIAFVNLLLDPRAGRPRLVRRVPVEPAYLVVRFPPQSIAEEAFFEADPTIPVTASGHPDPTLPPDTEQPPDPPVASRMAGGSRLVFRVPDEITEIPYTTTSLLDWTRLEPSLAPTALPSDPTAAEITSPPVISEPQPLETAIEFPYRLILSPNRTSGWAHALEPVTHAGRTELWHTRLGVARGGAVDEQDASTRTVRAIWSPDYDPSAPPDPAVLGPFRMPLTPNDRHQLVRLTSDYRIPTASVAVSRLMLSATGAWADLRGAWDLDVRTREAEGLSIEEWRHLATEGRDHYVRVVYEGFLYPFGHRASLVKITERKFQLSPRGDVVAYLRQRMFIIVREPVKQYDGSRFPGEGREMPFRASVRITTLVTPPLADPLEAPSAIDGFDAFWIRVGEGPSEQDFPFHVVVEDVEHRTTETTAALIFVSVTIAADGFVGTDRLDPVRAAYRDDARRRCPTEGSVIAFAERNPALPGDTNLATEALYFDTVTPTSLGPDGLGFLPKLDHASVRIPAAQQLVKNQDATSIELFGAYVDHGFDEALNQAQIFAELQTPLMIGVPPDRAGGLASPNLDVKGISQHLGPVAGDIDALARGEFDPTKFFDLGSATLLGSIPLGSLVAGVFDAAQFPKLLREELPSSVVTTLDFSPQVNEVPPIEHIDGRGEIGLQIHARIEQPLDGSQPTFRVEGALRDFALDFAGVIRVLFDELTFLAVSGRKLEVSARIAPDGVQFLGELAFVNELRKYIPARGFEDPPFLDVGPSGVTAGYSLGLPSLPLGAFSLENVALSAALFLPFTGDVARLRFAFSERHHPFRLTLGFIAGGGFFALSVTASGVESVEAALEAGGNVALDLGVAAGSVSAMIGLYFQLGPAGALVGGYLRINGEVEVLGLISVSIELYLALSYGPGAGKVRGEATLTVKVEIAFFSKSVSLHVERSFGGSGGDPSFAQMMPPRDFRAYGEAFA